MKLIRAAGLTSQSGTKIVARRFGAVPGTNVAKTTRTMQRTATDLRVRRI